MDVKKSPFIIYINKTNEQSYLYQVNTHILHALQRNTSYLNKVNKKCNLSTGNKKTFKML